MRLASIVSGLALIVAGVVLVAYGLLTSGDDKPPQVLALPAPSVESPEPPVSEVPLRLLPLRLLPASRCPAYQSMRPLSRLACWPAG